MSDWDQLGDVIATLAASSLMWVSSLLSGELPSDAAALAQSAPVVGTHQNLMIGWAQQTAEPPIEQVEEGSGDDVEALDEGAQAVETTEGDADTELLDQGSPPATQDEDVELLDQGSPPTSEAAPVAESTAPVYDTAAPATTYSAPATTAVYEPVVPEGFGTGNVHVSTGNGPFPVGLADCHVGAVTGRAYVGIDCGGDGNSIVGHAPSFENFPFVIEEGFPFNGESPFASNNDDGVSENQNIFVSAAQGNSESPEVRSSGATSVELKQKSRGRKPRIETEARGSSRSKESGAEGNGDVVRSMSDSGRDRQSAGANADKRSGEKGTRDSASSRKDGNKKAKNAKNGKRAKNPGGKKHGGQKSGKKH